MSKVALGFALGLLLLSTYLLGVKPGYTLAYALILLFVLAWLWPRYTARRISLSRHLDPGIPTVGDQFEETFTISRKGWVPGSRSATLARWPNTSQAAWCRPAASRSRGGRAVPTGGAAG